MKALPPAMLAMVAASAAALAVFDTTGASAREFNNPKVGGRLLDGCYRFPGNCNSRRQADAFCQLRGFDDAVDFTATNRAGLFTTRRLGDGGTCVSSCTVMTYVECE